MSSKSALFILIVALLVCLAGRLKVNDILVALKPSHCFTGSGDVAAA